MGGQDKKIVQFSSKIITQWKLQQRRISVLQQANGYRTGEQRQEVSQEIASETPPEEARRREMEKQCLEARAKKIHMS